MVDAGASAGRHSGGTRAAAAEPQTVGQHELSNREFTKSEKRKLRELAKEAYSRELDTALRDLDSAFSDWRKHHVSGFQLEELIHEFHQGPARELFSDYSRLDPGFLVARAVGRHLLEEAEVPGPLLKALAPLIAYCRGAYEEQDE